MRELEKWYIHDRDYVFEKVWGHEVWIVNNEEYCGKFLNLKRNYRCSTHYHKLKDETFYIMGGVVLMEVGNNTYILRTGEAVRVRRGVLHRFTGISDATILEISTQHFEDDSYRSNKSKKLNWREKRWLKKYLKNNA